MIQDSAGVRESLAAHRFRSNAREPVPFREDADRLKENRRLPFIRMGICVDPVNEANEAHPLDRHQDKTAEVR